VPVVWVGFDEWNWPRIDHRDVARFPLIRWSDIADIVLTATSIAQSPVDHLIQSFGRYLKDESRLPSDLREFILGDRGAVPSPPTEREYSQCFINALGCRWICDTRSG
jgi:hypothetical protein